METLREVMKYIKYNSLSKIIDSSISDEAKDYYLGVMRTTEFLLECTKYKDNETSK